MQRSTLLALTLFAIAFTAHGEAVHLERGQKSLAISIGPVKVMTYVWDDVEISRPYFANVRALDGTPVTRTHPPDPALDKGNDDHATFHPGLWLAFGDIGGADVWRLKAPVRNESLTLAAEGFAVVNRYEDGAGKAIAREHCTYRIVPAADGYYLLSHSEFVSTGDAFAFGDQEEMGFGVRLATGLSVKRGGALRNSAGGENEAGTWGKAAAWCAGYGRAGAGWAGVVLMPGAANFRDSWFHSRDYGLMVANPFGRKAMTGPEDAAMPPDTTRVTKDVRLALDFGVFVHAGTALPDAAAVYSRFKDILAEK